MPSRFRCGANCLLNVARDTTPDDPTGIMAAPWTAGVCESTQTTQPHRAIFSIACAGVRETPSRDVKAEPGERHLTPEQTQEVEEAYAAYLVSGSKQDFG